MNPEAVMMQHMWGAQTPAAMMGTIPPPPPPIVDPNPGVNWPGKQHLEHLQLVDMLEQPASQVFSQAKPVPQSSDEVDKLLDSNYAMICELLRLRHSRPAQKPTAVERKLMNLVMQNLALLASSQKPRSLVTSRAAQAARALVKSGKVSETVVKKPGVPPSHQSLMAGSMAGGMVPGMGAQMGLMGQGGMMDGSPAADVSDMLLGGAHFDVS